MKTSKILQFDTQKIKMLCRVPHFNINRLLDIKFIFIFIIISCKEESVNLNLAEIVNTNIKSDRYDFSIYGDSYDCDDDETIDCYESSCMPANPNDCGRQDLDPCDYNDMEEYSEAVACELTKIINGCTLQNAQLGCSVIELCVKIFLLHPL